MTPAVQNAEATLFDIRPATAWATDVQKAVLVEGAKVFRGQNPARGSAISYFLKSAPGGDVRISIADVTGREIRTIPGTKNAGLNRVQWISRRRLRPAAAAVRVVVRAGSCAGRAGGGSGSGQSSRSGPRSGSASNQCAGTGRPGAATPGRGATARGRRRNAGSAGARPPGRGRARRFRPARRPWHLPGEADGR